MAVGSKSSTIGEHIRWRRPKKEAISDPIPNLLHSTRCKSSICSLLSTFTTTTTAYHNAESGRANNNSGGGDRKKSFRNSTLRGFGCTTQPEVMVPAAVVIRSSADWEEKREKKEKKMKKKKKMNQKKKKKAQQLQGGGGVMREDVWCGPGIGGFGTDAAAPSSVDFVVSARPLFARGKIDIDKVHHRQRSSYSSRQRVNTELFAALNLESEIPRCGLDVFEDGYYRNSLTQSSIGQAEITMFQNGLVMGRRSGGLDRYRDWRLDVDNMTYEELLELGDRIGYVSTGLGEDQIGQCLRKTKLSVINELSSRSHIPLELKEKCSICQEQYEEEDEMGELECGHVHHLVCIKQWLAQKNACPLCNAEAASW